MSKRTAAMLLMAWFFFAPAHAQVYQCAGAAGKKVFQDRPCDGGQPVEIKTHVPSAEEKARAHLRAADNYLELAEIYEREGYRKKKCEEARSKEKRWQRSYSYYGRQVHQQAVEKARKYCK